MDIVWDEGKNSWLKDARNVSFEQIAGVIFAEQYLDIVDNESRENQQYFVISLQNYTWLVPFLVDDQKRIVLKTAFPSRKFHRKYGGTQ